VVSFVVAADDPSIVLRLAGTTCENKLPEYLDPWGWLVCRVHGGSRVQSVRNCFRWAEIWQTDRCR
jgi:hypothetical protein